MKVARRQKPPDSRFLGDLRRCVGKAYLLAMLPFHHLGVRTLLSNAVLAGPI